MAGQTSVHGVGGVMGVAMEGVLSVGGVAL